MVALLFHCLGRALKPCLGATLSLFAVLGLQGCSVPTLHINDTSEFAVMTKRLAPVLKERGILEADGSYYVPMFASSQPAQEAVGETLLKRLSPAFRFKVDPSLLPPTFADSVTSTDTLEMRPNGFVLTQGTDVITVSLIAQVDWNHAEPLDWLVVCRVKSLYAKTLRDYYLVVEQPHAAIMRPRLIAIYDCLNKRCSLFVNSAKETPMPVDPELPVIEVKAGEHNVTTPPNTPLSSPISGTTSTPQEGIQERTLGN